MKKLFFIFLMLNSTAAFAGNLYFSNGPLKGRDAAAYSADIGYYDVCFVGNPFAARSQLFSFLESDIEKTSVFTNFIRDKNLIVYGYVQTKCLDEGESPSQCRSVKTARHCL